MHLTTPLNVHLMLTRSKQLHENIMSRNGDVWAQKSTLTDSDYPFGIFKLFLTPPRLMEEPGQRWGVMYLCISGIDFSSFYDFDIWFWNCSDSVIFFVFLWFWNCSDSVVFFFSRFWNCSDSVIFFVFYFIIHIWCSKII